MKDPNLPVSRRTFLEKGALGAAAMGAGAAATGAAPATAKSPFDPDNPWRYDIESLRRVDPALVHYERFERFPVGVANPRRLAVGPEGRLHVVAGRSVLILAADGTRLGEIGVGAPARCVRPAGEGRVWVGLRDRVELYDGEGKRVLRGPALGGSPFLTGIAVAPGGEEIFVADSGNRVVYRCDGAGRVQLRIGQRDAAHGVPGLVLPSPFLDVEVGADGLLRINNPGRHVVERYTRDGEREGAWGRAGVAIDAFCGCCNPINLALFPDGRVVTAEKGLPRVKVYSADGRLESVVAAPSEFAAVASDQRETGVEDTVSDGLDVAIDATGRVWVLDLVGAAVLGFRRKATATASSGDGRAA